MFFLGRNKFKKMVNEKEASERFQNEIRPELEKGDLPAMIMAGLIVFMPVVILVGAMFWLLAFFLGR
jgi:hypothetical protein